MGCGFKIKYNSGELPDQSKSIAWGLIRNETSVANLDFELREKLAQKFSSNSNIEIKELGQSELVLSVQIQQTTITESEDEDEGEGQYLHLFTIKGQFTLVNEQSQKFYYSNSSLNVEHEYYKTSDTLTIFETEEGRRQALQVLVEEIYEKLTHQF